MSDKGVILTPSAKSANFDAMQVFPLNSDRSFKIEIAAGQTVAHTFADDTEMSSFIILPAEGGSMVFVDVQRGTDTTKWIPHWSGVWPWGVVEEPRSISFKSLVAATVIVLEA